MANKKQSLKYIRKTETRTARNKALRSRLKTLTRKYRGLGEDAAVADRKQSAQELVSAYDKAAKRGVVHANKASRIKAEVSPSLGA